MAIARTAFDRYSFDLIYARPDQTPQMWADELKLAISEAAEHLSLYQLTIEEGTPFFGLPQHRSGICDGSRGQILISLGVDIVLIVVRALISG